MKIANNVNNEMEKLFAKIAKKIYTYIILQKKKNVLNFAKKNN